MTKLRISDLWRWDGTVRRGPYALIGVVGFAIKHNLDRIVASAVFHKPWGLFNYWIPPVQVAHITALSRNDAMLLATMVAMALPFIWIGVSLTVRRLRDVGLPTALAVFFFAPVLNLAFFTILSILPSKPGATPQPPGGRMATFLERVIPSGRFGSAAMAVLVTVILGTACAALGTQFLARYGWGLFVALPFCLGLISALIYGWHESRGPGGCLLVATISLLFLSLALLGLAFEGVICLLMAAPLGEILALMGATFGYLLQRRPWHREQAPAALMALVLFAPLLMGAESAAPLPPPLLAVKTSIDIAAPPEIVWRRVVAFSELPPPRETLFRLGIAYPTRAIINGQGPGAVRHCEFSTGAFVEPIQVWDEPRLLQFSVVAQPAPMQEWTPYHEIHPRHLSVYLASERGQFLLTPLPSGGTHLEGTTWYRHHMWPADYWQLWSDAIIHRIHLRVLRHIKELAEQDASAPG
ncbi:MAG TPA: DUF805 domain-containing protein [Terriglobia bacterium]|nr:DUF805 domain-containing protein [Terriglobia bacterium]